VKAGRKGTEGGLGRIVLRDELGLSIQYECRHVEGVKRCQDQRKRIGRRAGKNRGGRRHHLLLFRRQLAKNDEEKQNDEKDDRIARCSTRCPGRHGEHGGRQNIDPCR